MNAATLQARIYSGYAKAAARIGYATDYHRATSASTPIAVGTKLGTTFASFNAEDMGYGKPDKYGKATWFSLHDGRLTQVGDYLTNAHDGTFFIAAQQQALPIVVVQCNRTASFLRPQQQSGVGALPYGGNVDATETALMTAWPCSILLDNKGDRGETRLPGDVRDGWWTILVPHYTGVTLRSGDIVKDDLTRRYAVGSAELTDLGWRIKAMQVQT